MTTKLGTFDNFVMFPFRLLWNIGVIVGTIWLEILWLGFVFGSIAGVILLLIFWLDGFVFPLLRIGHLPTNSGIFF